MVSPNDMPATTDNKRLSKPEVKRSNLCNALLPHANGINWHTCMRRKDHVLKAGKYARQHMDSKSTPPVYWDPTAEEILAAREVA